MKKEIGIVASIAILGAVTATAVAASAHAGASSNETTTTTSAEQTSTTSTTSTTVASELDTVPPRIVSLHISKSEATYGESFDVFIETADNVEVVVAMAVPRFVSVTGYADRYELCVSGNDWRAPRITSGDGRRGVWSMTCVVPAGIEAGTYVFMPFAHDSSDNKSYIVDTSENPETWATIQIR